MPFINCQRRRFGGYRNICESQYVYKAETPLTHGWRPWLAMAMKRMEAESMEGRCLKEHVPSSNEFLNRFCLFVEAHDAPLGNHFNTNVRA